MNLITKIAGIIIIGIGLGIFYIDYIIFTAIGALSLWIATLIGATGGAATGIQIVGWLLTLGIMIVIAILGSCTIWIGLKKVII